jgi:murein DD-endopeptidase MepM/ murein hydrolase activator NlpD
MVKVGSVVKKGELIATIGDEKENGGWPPHLHLQISYEQPVNNDLPGVVKLADRDASLKIYPDPRLIIGPVY